MNKEEKKFIKEYEALVKKHQLRVVGIPYINPEGLIRCELRLVKEKKDESTPNKTEDK